MNVNFLWDMPDDPRGNVEKLRQHGLTPDDAILVVETARMTDVETSRSSGRPIVFGSIFDGRYIAVPFDFIDRDTVKVVTAFEVPEP